MGRFKKAIQNDRKRRSRTTKNLIRQSTDTKRSSLKTPVLLFWRRIQRGILICSGILFCGFLYAAYTWLAPATTSTVGKMATSGAGWALSPVVASLPWWFWGGVLGIAVYLWVKHTLVMSIVFGVLVGIGLALS